MPPSAESLDESSVSLHSSTMADDESASIALSSTALPKQSNFSWAKITDRRTLQTFQDSCTHFLKAFENDSPPSHLRSFVSAVLMLQCHVSFIQRKTENDQIITNSIDANENALKVFISLIKIFDCAMKKASYQLSPDLNSILKLKLSSDDFASVKAWNSIFETEHAFLPLLDARMIENILEDLKEESNGEDDDIKDIDDSFTFICQENALDDQSVHSSISKRSQVSSKANINRTRSITEGSESDYLRNMLWSTERNRGASTERKGLSLKSSASIDPRFKAARSLLDVRRAAVDNASKGRALLSQREGNKSRLTISRQTSANRVSHGSRILSQQNLLADRVSAHISTTKSSHNFQNETFNLNKTKINSKSKHNLLQRQSLRQNNIDISSRIRSAQSYAEVRSSGQYTNLNQYSKNTPPPQLKRHNARSRTFLDLRLVGNDSKREYEQQKQINSNTIQPSYSLSKLRNSSISKAGERVSLQHRSQQRKVYDVAQLNTPTSKQLDSSSLSKYAELRNVSIINTSKATTSTDKVKGKQVRSKPKIIVSHLPNQSLSKNYM